jgi:hypothetical protein
MKQLLCREIVGRRVKLLQTITTNGGWSFKKGRVMKVHGTYNGNFNLECLRRPPMIKNKDGSQSCHSGITRVSRDHFEILPKQRRAL